MYVDRMSVNIELPSSTGLKLLAPQKNKEAILGPMGHIKNKIIENKHDMQRLKNSLFCSCRSKYSIDSWGNSR